MGGLPLLGGELVDPLLLIDGSSPTRGVLITTSFVTDFFCSGVEDSLIPFARLLMLSPIWGASTNSSSAPVSWAAVPGARLGARVSARLGVEEGSWGLMLLMMLVLACRVLPAPPWCPLSEERGSAALG